VFRTTLVVQESSFRRLNSSTISPSRRGRRGGEVQAETVRSRADAARPHPEADGVRRGPEFAAPPRMTGLSAPRLGEVRALLGTARPRRCLTAAAVRGWAGMSRCRGTPATAGAAGGAGRTRSHDAARPWVRQCARRLLQWGQSLTARPARGARRAPRPRPARPGHRRPRRTPRGRTTRRRAAPTRPAGPATDPWSPGRPLTQQCRAPAARSRPTPDNADRSASVRLSRLDVIPPATAPACQLSNIRSHKDRSNGYADEVGRATALGRGSVSDCLRPAVRSAGVQARAGAR